MNHTHPTPYMTQVLTAAEEGNPEAQYCLGLHYSGGNEGFERNDELAMHWLKKAGQQLYVPAMYALFIQYLTGKNCEPNERDAYYWGGCYVYEASPDEPQYPPVAYHVGIACMNGVEMKRSTLQGLELVYKAARLGYAEAQAAIGFFLLEESSCLYDPEQAFMWFEKAVQSNLSDAQRGLGLCYLLGEGVEQNLQEAKRWFRLAAEQGDEKAVLALKKYCRGKA